MAQQQADALVLVAETALHHGIDSSVLENADSPGQSVMEGGARVSAETSQRVACDASRVVMEHDADGRVVEVGAADGVTVDARTATPSWFGEHLDVGWAIDVLHPLATGR